MKKFVLVQSAVIVVLVVALMLVTFGSAESWRTGVAHADTGSDEVPPTDRTMEVPGEPTAPNAGATTLVYFSTTDSDATATVIILYNTTAVTQTVVVKGYVARGAFATWNVAVGPNNLVHLVSDSVAASPPPSWANSVVTNFTDFTTYATLDVPSGVKIDGYVVFNPGTGTVDPRVDQGAIPLRFSTDPYTVMLPAVNR